MARPMLPITNPRGGGDARSSSSSWSSSSSSALDQWTKRFQEAERLVDDVAARIAERESVPPTLPRELQRRTAEIRRKVAILGTRLDMLREDLSDLPKKQNISLKQLNKLAEKLSGLSSKAKEVGGQFTMRNVLFGAASERHEPPLTSPPGASARASKSGHAKAERASLPFPFPSSPATRTRTPALRPLASPHMEVMEEVERDTGGWDFLDWVGPDTSACIFHLLGDPADLARAAAVSRSWRQFVIDNGFCKSLCRRICPEVANFTRAVVVTRSAAPAPGSGSSSRDAGSRDHAVYSRLGGALAAAAADDRPPVDCMILHCIGASSTDYFPDETIENTLHPQERVDHRPSYWSSGGQVDPDVPESLTYRLSSDLCVIHEVRVRPFKAVFQTGHPIYSSKAVRIRLGHSKLPRREESLVTDENENLKAVADENYVWTYTSPEFPMLQENVLQTFKLPRPVLCIGGVVKIELLGRIQKQATDDKYYICVCHAKVMGRSLSPEFMVDISDPADYSILKYLPGASKLRLEDIMISDPKDSAEWNSLVARYRQMTHRVTADLLLGPVHFMDDEEDDVGAVTDDDIYM